MNIKYKCALRHSNDHCPVYFEKFPIDKCNSKCPAFVSSKHTCKPVRGANNISICRKYGTSQIGGIINWGDEEYNINYCPYCGDKLSHDITALKVAMQRFYEMEHGNGEVSKCQQK